MPPNQNTSIPLENKTPVLIIIDAWLMLAQGVFHAFSYSLILFSVILSYIQATHNSFSIYVLGILTVEILGLLIGIAEIYIFFGLKKLKLWAFYGCLAVVTATIIQACILHSLGGGWPDLTSIILNLIIPLIYFKKFK